MICRSLIKNEALYRSPEGKPPPFWIRSLLMLTCTGVSFAHGSNDGQKGMGLIMLILIGIVPGTYAVNLATRPAEIGELSATVQTLAVQMSRHVPGATAPASPAAGSATPSTPDEELSRYLKTNGKVSEQTFPAVVVKCRQIVERLTGKSSLRDLDIEQRRLLRTDLFLLSETLAKLNKQSLLPNPSERKSADEFETRSNRITKFIPFWVKVAVALALGIGTMIGWKRIVVTIGEKIGKEHLTYAQGASAELVAMATIGIADTMGLPVSTTHVLSSGIAGTMVANRSGLQVGTLRNLLLAWVLTLPVCVLMGAGLFAFALNIVLNVFGFK